MPNNKRVNLSEVLAAEQEAAQKRNAATEQSSNTVKPQSSDTALPEESKTIINQKDFTVLPQNNNDTSPQDSNNANFQSGNSTLLQSENTTIPHTRKTDERIKATYYLEPGQADKLEDLRIEYRKATGVRLNEQNFMRLIIDRLDLQALL